jgi:GntR family phosphonate transport system transcriptional regulator
MTSTSLARGEGIALWRQIARRLEAEIAGMAPGTRLPTEAEASARFGVNRHTIRRAMEELAGRGLLRIEQGRGSFVADDVLDYRLGSRTRFSELVRQQNREPAGRILGVERLPATAPVAEALGLRRRAMVLRVARLGLADGRPVTLGLHHFPLPRFTALPARLADDPSVTAALAACGVADYRRQVTRITARMPSPEEATALQQGHALPVLATEAVDVDAAGTPVGFTQGVYAAARVQLVVAPEDH